MVVLKTASFWRSSLCLRAQARARGRRHAVLWAYAPSGARSFTVAARLQDSSENAKRKNDVSSQTVEEKEQGALSRRLSEMAEETMNTGSKSDRKLMADVGFSEDLRKQLEERIAQTAFKADNQQALSEVNMPVCQSHLQC